MVKDILQELGVLRPGNIFVTDNGANVKAVFADHIWISCLGHNLNLAVSHGFKWTLIRSYLM